MIILYYLFLKDVCMYVCRVFCPEAGPSLDMHHQGSTYLSFLGKGEVVCQFLSSLSLPCLSLHTQT